MRAERSFYAGKGLTRLSRLVQSLKRLSRTYRKEIAERAEIAHPFSLRALRPPVNRDVTVAASRRSAAP